jgi:hypothetical protein
MKRTRSTIKIFALIALIGSLYCSSVSAATQEEIDTAIADGITWLAAQQNLDGSWGTYYEVGHTSFAVLKFETHALQNETDPLDPTYTYYNQVRNGLDYIFAQAYNISISAQPAGDPDTNGNGWGTYFTVDPSHRVYETSIAMMAIAASTHPELTVNVPGSVVNGSTYFDVLQDVVDYMAFGQEDAPSTYRGGWRYYEHFGSADNSVTGLVTLGLGYAEAAQIEGATGFSCTVPNFVKTELDIWIDYIQNDVDGDTNDGGSGYASPTSWVNILKTGNLLTQLAFVGDSVSSQRVGDAIDYIERHWNDANDDPGWRGSPASYLAMYSVVKGLDAYGIETLDVGGPVDWFDEMADVLIAQQNPDGSWPTPDWGSPVLGTEWALLFLQRVTAIEVPHAPVGGELLAVDKLMLLAPYVLLVAAIVVAVVAGRMFLKR